MRYIKQTYRLSFIYALLVHVALILLLFISLATPYQKTLSVPSGDIVQADLLDEKQVQALTHPVKPEQKKMAEQKALEPQKQEKAKLTQAKQPEIEENNLAQIQLAKQKEQQELEALRAQKAKEEKRLAALEDKRSEEQERANQMRLEREKEERKKKDKLEAKRKSEAEKRAAQVRAAEEAQLAATTAKRQQWVMSEREKYMALVKDKIQGGWLRPEGLPPGLKCLIKIGAVADGTVHTVTILKSSGNLAFDQTATAAVYNAAPLPFPPGGQADLTDEFLNFTLDFKDSGEVIEYAM